MKAVLLTSVKKTEYTNIEDAILQNKDDVILKVKAVGLCGSDMHRLNSERDPRSYLETLILGHEISGVIVQKGTDVTNLDIGVRLTVLPLFYSDTEASVNYPLSITGSLGKSKPGGFAEYVVVPKENLHSISDKLTFDEAALTDVAAVAVHAYNLAGQPSRKKVMIIGDGSVGLACLQMFDYGKNEVHIIGKHNDKLTNALGGTYIDQAMEKFIKPNTYDITIETVGRDQSETINTAIRISRPRGRIIFLGVFPEKYVAQVNIREALYKEVSLLGANSYLPSEFVQALSMMESRDLLMERLITHRLNLSDFDAGVNAMNNKRLTKAVKVVYNP